MEIGDIVSWLDTISRWRHCVVLYVSQLNDAIASRLLIDRLTHVKFATPDDSLEKFVLIA